MILRTNVDQSSFLPPPVSYTCRNFVSSVLYLKQYFHLTILKYRYIIALDVFVTHQHRTYAKRKLIDVTDWTEIYT